MIIRLADIIKKPAIMLIHIDEVLKDKPPGKELFLCRGLCRKTRSCRNRRKEEFSMSRQEIKKNYNEAEEKNFDISQEIQEEETRHMDYIYMVNGDKLIIRMNAELDHHLAEEMRQVIDDVIDKRGVMHIVFDFTKVDFMDSAGIGLIMGRYKKVMDKGDITIVGVRESVKRILLISGLHKIVNIYELKGQEV